MLWLLGLLFCCSSTVSAADAGCHTPEMTTTRHADYVRSKQRAWAWLDQLDVDPMVLQHHDIKGYKKLAEILQGYLQLYRYTQDVGERARIQQRVTQLADSTRNPAYHGELLGSADAEFRQNSLSYLRVLWLLEHLGQDTTPYRQHLHTMQPRLDAQMPQRGPWQQAMFAAYYTRFGLPLPPGLSLALDGLVVQRYPLAQYDRNRAYQLTHEVFVAFDYGLQRTQQHFSAADRDYLYTILPALARAALQQREDDLLAEVMQCMTYLGWHTAPEYCQGLRYLLESQNANGTWGNYAALQQRGVPYIDQRLYLHTTVVTLQALSEAFEGHWPRAD